MNANMAIGRAGRMLAIIGLTASAGCLSATIDADFSGVDPSIPVADLRIRGNDQTGIQDGTSNTIAIGEATPGDSRIGRLPRIDAAGDGSSGDQPVPSDAAPGEPAAGDTADQDAAVNPDAANRRALLSALEDRLLTFGDSSFFSGGSITDSNELQLCAFGKFAMRVTRVTSTSLDTFSSESLLIGSWSIETVGDAALIVLNVESASSADDLGLRRLPVAIDPISQRIIVNGAPAESFDVAADCATAAGG